MSELESLGVKIAKREKTAHDDGVPPEVVTIVRALLA